jgi:hypothetical protein
MRVDKAQRESCLGLTGGEVQEQHQGGGVYFSEELQDCVYRVEVVAHVQSTPMYVELKTG